MKKLIALTLMLSGTQISAQSIDDIMNQKANEYMNSTSASGPQQETKKSTMSMPWDNSNMTMPWDNMDMNSKMPWDNSSMPWDNMDMNSKMPWDNSSMPWNSSKKNGMKMPWN
jgi:hypothetical protein